MTVITPTQFIRAMRRTTTILDGILSRVTQEEATTLRYEGSGWTVTEIVCHLRDRERIYFNRVVQMLHEDRPNFERIDHEARVIEEGYNSQNMHNAFRAFVDTRHKLITLFDGLTRNEWNRSGIHPMEGVVTVLDFAMLVVAHDIEHTEQIVRVLGLPSLT